MDKFKGTPGPWLACCANDGMRSHYVFSHNGNGGSVCALTSNDPNDTKEDYIDLEDIVTLEERQANARLIQAAPEMLEALQRVMKAIDSQDLNDRFGHTQQYIKEAIDKALCNELE